jgi:hypothetical protein
MWPYSVPGTIRRCVVENHEGYHYPNGACVDIRGLEPRTFAVSERRSHQMS